MYLLSIIICIPFAIYAVLLANALFYCLRKRTVPGIEFAFFVIWHIIINYLTFFLHFWCRPFSLASHWWPCCSCSLWPSWTGCLLSRPNCSVCGEWEGCGSILSRYGATNYLPSLHYSHAYRKSLANHRWPGYCGCSCWGEAYIRSANRAPCKPYSKLAKK